MGSPEISATALRKLSDPLMELPKIPQTLSVELAKRLPLAWSPYVTLLTIDNPAERQSSAKNRDKGQFSDPFEALPTFLPEAEGNWSDSFGPIGILGSVVALLTIDNPAEAASTSLRPRPPRFSIFRRVILAACNCRGGDVRHEN